MMCDCGGRARVCLGTDMVGWGDGRAMACVAWRKGWKHKGWNSWDCGGRARARVCMMASFDQMECGMGRPVADCAQQWLSCAQ
jgi:hypothetical protein